MKLVYKGSYQAPAYETRNSAGFDLRSEITTTIPPLSRVLIPTGLFIESEGNLAGVAYIRIAPRSGLAYKQGIEVMAGVVDLDYREEIKVILINLGAEPVVITAGERIAQGVLESIFRAPIEVKNVVRNGGFNSTGDK